MKKTLFGVASIVLLAIALQGSVAAQVEMIPPTTVPPGPPGASFFYTNALVPPPHEKVFRFVGGAENLGFPGPSPLVIYFDWVEPSGTFTSPPITFTLSPFTTNPIDTGDFILPFCPSSVSIHFETDTAPALVVGSFSHICRPVPEPSAWANSLLAIGSLGLGLRWRRPR